MIETRKILVSILVDTNDNCENLRSQAVHCAEAEGVWVHTRVDQKMVAEHPLQNNRSSKASLAARFQAVFAMRHGSDCTFISIIFETILVLVESESEGQR